MEILSSSTFVGCAQDILSKHLLNSLIFVLNPAISDIKLGRNLARTFLDYYKLTGFISTKPSSGLMPKAGRGSARDRDRTGQRTDRASSEPVSFRQDGDR